MHALRRGTRIRHVALAIVMAAVLGYAAQAGAQDDTAVNAGSAKTTCPDGQATMLESKTCPERPGRPAFVLQRACCTKNARGVLKTRCKAFPHCPSQSPS
jgi:hypothetical protein